MAPSTGQDFRRGPPSMLPGQLTRNPPLMYQLYATPASGARTIPLSQSNAN